MTTITQTITTLPTAPDPATDTPTDFSTKAAAMVLAQKSMVPEMNTWAGQVNTVKGEINVSAAAAAASAAAALVSENAAEAVALSAANFKGTYASRSGAATMPYSVSHTGGFWMLIQNMADVTTKVPGSAGSEAYWQRIDRPPPMLPVTDPVLQVVSGGAYAFRNTTAQASTTNNLLYSDDPGNAVWGKTAGVVTVTTAFTMDPDGGMLGAKIAQSATNGELNQTVVAAGTSTQTAIRYFKYGSSTAVQIVIFWLNGGATQTAAATINPQTGALSGVGGSVSAVSASAVYVGAGWYRVALSGTGTDAANTHVQVSVYDLSGGASYYCTYRGQITPTAGPTSDIGTGATAVTRPAGVIAPQRAVLPASPTSDQWCRLLFENGSDANVIDPNGQTLRGATTPIEIDSTYPGWIDLQFVDGAWRM